MKRLGVGLALMVAACSGANDENLVLDPSRFETAAQFLSCMEGGGALVSAHRGGPAPGFPENAIETFNNTLSQIPALIETDVRQTADGVFVLLHDSTVDRTTNGSGEIADLTLEEAKALKLLDENGDPTDFQIPTLDEALKAMRGKTIIQLDVKRGISVADVARQVAARDAEAFAAIITYTSRDAMSAAGAAPGVSVIAGVDDRADYRRLTSSGLNADRMIAWTGLIDETDPALYGFLGGLDISTSGGAIGKRDREAEAGRRGVYRELERDGLDIVATDRPLEAADELDMRGIAERLTICTPDIG